MTRQQWCRALLAIAVLAVAPRSDAQQVSTRRPAATPRAQREKILIRIDSLMYEFDHAPVSAEESESLRVEMVRAMHAIEPAMAFSYQDMSPQGYLGVTFDGPSVELPRPNERVIRFLDYPRVSMVEPGSPAERGGVAKGDTLIALDGLNVKDREISLTRILVPSRRIMVRVLREGRTRDLRVTVDTSPEYMARRMVPMAPTPMVAAAPGVAATAAPMPPDAMMYAMPRTPRVAPVMAMGEMDMWADADGVAGARLVAVSEGLGKALGVKSGVLVLRASPGTPAYESGLREGDVIVRAEGKSVTSVRDVRRVASGADREDGVSLVVLRERRERPVTLRW
jgi:serine protease Do